MDIERKPRQASAQAIKEVLASLSVDANQGLTIAQVEKRQQTYGLNQLQKVKGRTSWQIFVDQFKSPIIGLLGIAAILSFAFREWIEGIAILIAIALNAGIGFITEIKAVRSMEALQKLSQTYTTVRRNGRVSSVKTEELVPGDIILLEGGDLVPADLRVLECSKLQADESALTGESVPVSKSIAPLEANLPLAEQKNLLFKGSAVTRGSGTGVVIATGMGTELGKISKLMAEAEAEVTPLEKRLEQLSQRLIGLTLVLAVFVAVSGILGGQELLLMVETAIALAVAVIPEGLPIVATVALARGMWRMAKRNALMNRLSAVETLGATNIICTDKTGTLTENRMTLTQIALADRDVELTGQGLSLEGEFFSDQNQIDPHQQNTLQALLMVAVLCNNATLPDGTDKETLIGDPTEIALLVAGAKAGLDRHQLLQDLPEVREVAFDSESKRMATIHQADDWAHPFASESLEGSYLVAVKGALETVLPLCSHYLMDQEQQPLSHKIRKQWRDRCHDMAADGLRVLGFAYKIVDEAESDPYENLVWLGLGGLLDPPRLAVKQAIQDCHQAGIRVIMLTGDQPVTARKIGLAVGLISEETTQVRQGEALDHLDQLSASEQQQLLQVPIFARVTPEQKLNLIALHQRHQAIIAMTGDGINDAPALKKADIGIAMGNRGTQVAKESADMVLQDDAFSTIVIAIAQGRTIFNNIRKFTLYLLSGNVGEIIAVAIASFLGAPLPILPLQILFLNAVNDVFPALALGAGEGDAKIMQRPPRDPREPLLTHHYWVMIGWYGLIIASTLLGIFAIALQVLALPREQAVTISFLTLAFGRLWHVFNMRDADSGLFQNEITVNPYIWAALGLCTGLLLLATYTPGISTVLGLVNPGLQGWGLILGGSLIPLVLGQLRHRGGGREAHHVSDEASRWGKEKN
ncbi:ATPase, P-type (transporting), HAD superfamily, subfamily IC [Halothece sp. PCC 7418]|uniref:cation-translocating P-type ATPase n=1 Tax=Halothece sp. (strain PCC 7418) TaxID=65093 RepID=UPI0002A069EB|nr:cation-transporting P-type ATPase [Halothece sp. PCC 7418]AFZ43641.1 ATPase, P-type (transporting), HAD superfamily, subfamily IC [Halothece sp. PCC 7418]